MRKSTAVMIAAIAFLFGMVGGFALAPVRHGIRINIGIGDNSGNSNEALPAPGHGKKYKKKDKKLHRLPQKSEILKSVRKKKENQ